MASCSTSSFQVRSDAKAAKRFFRRLLKGLQYVPRVIVTDKLRSYGVAKRRLLPGVDDKADHSLGHATQEVAISGFGQQLGQR
jgi:putative transposase